jgi:8-oxo-dGTP pyrophosphatase MutT (NUDIX family)
MADRYFSEDVPHEHQTLRLPPERLDAFESWAREGTALAAGASVRDAAGRIALVRNTWSDGWILPGGAVEPDEDPATTARREVREETGLSAEIDGPLLEIAQSYVNAETGSERYTATYLVYAASADGEIPGSSDLGVHADEIEAARWFETLPEQLHDEALLRPYLDSDSR